MGGGAAATRVGVVDQVVVHERRGLEDLERGAGVPERGRLLVDPLEAGDRGPSGVTEPGAQALAAAQRGLRRGDERRGVRPVGCGLLAHPDEPGVETGGDLVDHGGGSHGISLPSGVRAGWAARAAR